MPTSLVARMPARLRELVGYGICNGLVGHIDKRTPAEVLLGTADRANKLVRDQG